MMFFYRSKCYLFIRHVVGDNFVYQQDSAPAHRARDTIELCSVKHLISFIQIYVPRTCSPDLNPVDYKI